MTAGGDDPLFSIVVPTYNRAHLIGATLQTLLAQSERSFEVIVVDDGSTDDTEGAVRRLADPRLFYHRKVNAERGAARNFGARQARGAYLNFFDSDDLAAPRHLAEARALIEVRNRPELVFLRYDVSTPGGPTREVVAPLADRHTGQIPTDALLDGNPLSCNGVFLRRDIALAFPFEEDRALSGTEDWVLWMKLVCRFPMYENRRATSTIVQHEARSVSVASLRSLEQRTSLTAHYLSLDSAFMQRFGQRGVRRVQAQMHSYTALHAALGAHGLDPVLRHLTLAARLRPRELLRRRTLAVVKHLLRNRMFRR